MGEVRFESYPAQPGRMVMARLKRDTDLVTGLIEICRANNIQTGLVEIAIGSLRSATICWAVPADNKRGAHRSDPIQIPGPLEFITGQGIICLKGEKPAIHFHGTMTDQYGRSWSGHIFPGGNPIHVTMDVAIREISGVVMRSVYDEELDVDVTVPAADEE